jgi:hypothetical protein
MRSAIMYMDTYATDKHIKPSKNWSAKIHAPNSGLLEI